jgi:hypothetical protein
MMEPLLELLMLKVASRSPLLSLVKPWNETATVGVEPVRRQSKRMATPATIRRSKSWMFRDFFTGF